MKSIQQVEINAENIYVGWQGLEVTDSNGDEVRIKLSNEQYISLLDRISTKVKRIREDQREKLQKELEELDAESDC